MLRSFITATIAQSSMGTPNSFLSRETSIDTPRDFVTKYAINHIGAEQIQERSSHEISWCQKWLRTKPGFPLISQNTVHAATKTEEVVKQVFSWFEGEWSKYRERFRLELALKLENMPAATAEACKKAIETPAEKMILQMRNVSFEMFGELIAMKVRLEMLEYRHNL